MLSFICPYTYFHFSSFQVPIVVSKLLGSHNQSLIQNQKEYHILSHFFIHMGMMPWVTIHNIQIMCMIWTVMTDNQLKYMEDSQLVIHFAVNIYLVHFLPSTCRLKFIYKWRFLPMMHKVDIIEPIL